MTSATIAFVWRRYPPPKFLGGAERSMQILGSSLAANGWEVSHIGSDDLPWNAPREKTTSKAYVDAHYKWRGQTVQSVAQNKLIPALEKLLSTSGPSYIVSSHEGSDEIVRLARAYGATTIGWLHSISATGLLVLKGRPDLALAVSKFVQTEAQIQEQVKARVLYPPFELRPPFKSRSPHPSVMMVGAIPEKGLALTLDLAAALPDVEFVIAEGWYSTALPDVKNVRFLPRAPLEAEFDSAWLTIVPSQVSEAFGRVAVEAALRSRPVLVSNKGGLPEAVCHIGEAIVIGNDARAWVPRIWKILSDLRYAENLASKLRAAAQRYAGEPALEFQKAIGGYFTP